MDEILMTPIYQPPGVTITEAVRPQIVPLVTETGELVIVGPAAGHQKRTDQIVSQEGVEQSLPYLEQVPNSKLGTILKVYNAFRPSEPPSSKGEGYVEGTDWVATGKAATPIKFKTQGEGGRIPAGTVINVTYTYTSGDYFNPIRLFNASEVEARFGSPYSENAETSVVTVNSPLTLAALKAFENGARSVICQPLFVLVGEVETIEYNTLGFIINAEAPTKLQQENIKTWERTLEALGAVEQIDLIVAAYPTLSSPLAAESIFNALAKFEQDRALEQQYVISVNGLDTTVTGLTYEEIRKAATTLASYADGAYSQQNILVNTTNFKVRAEKGETVVGGQYVAAAIAGKLAGSPASVSITRKAIGGFRSINDQRNATEKNFDAEAGLCVVEEIRGGVIRVRHGITIDTEGGAARSEISVVRAKFNLIESIRTTLEDQVIGKIIADANSPLVVRSTIGAVLAILERTGEIVSYRVPNAKISSLEPTTITASFSYRPAFALNYIDIVFSLDLESQTVTVTEEQSV